MPYPPQLAWSSLDSLQPWDTLGNVVCGDNGYYLCNAPWEMEAGQLSPMGKRVVGLREQCMLGKG